MAPISALLQRFCMLIFVHLTTGTGHFWRTICDVADKEGERGQKALDELIAAIPAIATMQEHEARPLIERIADGYVEPPEGDPLSPPVGLSTEALGRLMIAHDCLRSGSRLPVGALVQAGSPAPPSVVELASRLTSAQWNAEGEQARKVIEAVLALNGSPLGSSKASAPREEILAELKVPAGANLLDSVAALMASGGLQTIAKKLQLPEAPEPAPSPPPVPPSPDLLRAIDGLRAVFSVQIGADPHIQGNWLVNLIPCVPGAKLGFSAPKLEQALLKAIDGGRRQLEEQSERIDRALEAIRGAQ